MKQVLVYLRAINTHDPAKASDAVLIPPGKSQLEPSWGSTLEHRVVSLVEASDLCYATVDIADPVRKYILGGYL